MKDLVQKATGLFRKIVSYEYEKSYDLKLALYADGESENAECTHHLSGTSRHNLCRMLCLLALCMLPLGLAVKVWTLCRRG